MFGADIVGAVPFASAPSGGTVPPPQPPVSDNPHRLSIGARIGL